MLLQVDLVALSSPEGHPEQDSADERDATLRMRYSCCLIVDDAVELVVDSAVGA